MGNESEWDIKKRTYNTKIWRIVSLRFVCAQIKAQRLRNSVPKSARERMFAFSLAFVKWIQRLWSLCMQFNETFYETHTQTYIQVHFMAWKFFLNPMTKPNILPSNPCEIRLMLTSFCYIKFMWVTEFSRCHSPFSMCHTLSLALWLISHSLSKPSIWNASRKFYSERAPVRCWLLLFSLSFSFTLVFSCERTTIR